MFLRRIRMFLPMSHAMTNKLETPNTVPLYFPLKLNAAPPLNQGPSWHGYQEKRRWRGKEKNCCNFNRANSIAALYSISLKKILKHCVQAFLLGTSTGIFTGIKESVSREQYFVLSCFIIHISWSIYSIKPVSCISLCQAEARPDLAINNARAYLLVYSVHLRRKIIFFLWQCPFKVLNNYDTKFIQNS